MQFLGAADGTNHPHSLANPKNKAQSKERQRMPTRLEQMAEHVQNVLSQYTLHYVKMM